jgi:uncharacterized coiled-coil protein SlyX
MDSQQQVRRYLLGNLPEQEQLALEQEYFCDDELFDRVWELENELVDSYVRGKLERDERKLFERNYLQSPVHRRRVAFSTALLETVDAKLMEPRTAAAPSKRWWADFPVSLRWATVAAVIVLSAITIILFFERASLHKRLDRLYADASSQQQHTRELEDEIAAQRDQSDKLKGELARMRAEAQAPTSSSQPSIGETRSVLSFLLSPIVLRGGGEAQQLKLEKQTTSVLFRMNVQPPAARLFQVVLRTVDGVKVFEKASLQSHRQAGDNFTLALKVPASKLEPGDYILTLSATNGVKAPPEEVNRFFFRVSRQ